MSIRRTVALLVFPCCLLSCGRPATQEECEEIVERITKLELAAAYDVSASEVQREVDDAKRALHARMMKDCVGSRVSDAALECMRAATSSQKATACFE